MTVSVCGFYSSRCRGGRDAGDALHRRCEAVQKPVAEAVLQALAATGWILIATQGGG